MKLEYAFEFKTQCEETYRKLIEQLENSNFSDQSESFSKSYRIHDQDDVQDDLEVESEQIHFEELEIVERPGQSINDESAYVLSDDQEEDNSYNGYYTNQLQTDYSEAEDIAKEVETLPVECDVSVSSSEEIIGEGDGETEETVKANGSIVDQSTCTICHKSFRGNLDLTDHMEGMHFNRKRHECVTCGAKYTHYVSLIRHQQVHVDDDIFPCDICGKIFKTKKYMRAHRKIHFVTFNSTASSLVCKICNHRSQNNNHHLKHLQTHQGDKPHKCIVCGKGFLRKQYLNEHHRMHTGERPFPCNICSYAFRYRTHLSRHLKTHANKKT